MTEKTESPWANGEKADDALIHSSAGWIYDHARALLGRALEATEHTPAASAGQAGAEITGMAMKMNAMFTRMLSMHLADMAALGTFDPEQTLKVGAPLHVMMLSTAIEICLKRNGPTPGRSPFEPYNDRLEAIARDLTQIGREMSADVERQIKTWKRQPLPPEVAEALKQQTRFGRL